MYYMRLCSDEYSTVLSHLTMIKMMTFLNFFFWFEIGNYPPTIGKKDTFWHWEYNPITAIKSTKNKPWFLYNIYSIKQRSLSV